MWLHRDLKRHRSVCFDPIYHQNPRSERFSNPFSDSFRSGILGTSHQTSGGGIMLVVEKDAPLQLKREEGTAA